MTIQVGTFKARAVGADFGYTKGGKEQVAVLFEFIDGPNEGKQITWYGYFTDKTVDRTLESLMHAGWDGKNLAALSGIGESECLLVLESDTYEGKTRVRVNWINKIGTGPSIKEPMSESQLASFSQKMAGKLLALQQRSTKAQELAFPADDDTPF